MGGVEVSNAGKKSAPKSSACLIMMLSSRMKHRLDYFNISASAKENGFK